MRTSIVSLGLVAYAAVCFGAEPRAAQADVFSMAAGTQSGSGPVCYRWSASAPVGATKNTAVSCAAQKYVMPLYWSNPPLLPSTFRTISVRGRRPTAGSTLECKLSAYTSNGVLAAQDTEAFPVTGTNFDVINLTVNNLTASSSSFITCTMIGANTYLQRITYTP